MRGRPRAKARGGVRPFFWTKADAAQQGESGNVFGRAACCGGRHWETTPCAHAGIVSGTLTSGIPGVCPQCDAKRATHRLFAGVYFLNEAVVGEAKDGACFQPCARRARYRHLQHTPGSLLLLLLLLVIPSLCPAVPRLGRVHRLRLFLFCFCDTVSPNAARAYISQPRTASPTSSLDPMATGTYSTCSIVGVRHRPCAAFIGLRGRFLRARQTPLFLRCSAVRRRRDAREVGREGGVACLH